MTIEKSGGGLLSIVIVLGLLQPSMASAAFNRGTKFDLGIGIGNAIRTPQDAAAFVAHKPAQMQSAIKAACRNYAQHPQSARSIDTVVFCRLLSS